MSKLRDGALRVLTVCGVALATSSVAGMAGAQPFTLQGKTVNVLVSGGVGGGLDAYARIFLPYLSKHLPGEPAMVVQNLPGGGGVQGVQRLYNVSAKDGTSIGTTPAGPVKEPLMGSGQVNYDLRRFGWIGSLTNEDTVCVVWHTSPVKSLEDARQREVPISATGTASNSTIGPLLLNDLLGTKFKPISGYDGGTSMLAVERGEVEGRCTTLNSMRTAQPHWLTDKLVRVLVVVSSVDDPEFASVPRAKDLLKTDAERKAFDFFQAPDEIQNPYMLPPGTPAEVLATYRKAFDAALKDPAYLADAEKRKQKLVPQNGEFVEKTIASMYDTPTAVIERVKQATSVTGRVGEKK
jgi:tripartite-type tricarboxylate transporter receptor subunit TctC